MKKDSRKCVVDVDGNQIVATRYKVEILGTMYYANVIDGYVGAYCGSCAFFDVKCDICGARICDLVSSINTLFFTKVENETDKI